MKEQGMQHTGTDRAARWNIAKFFGLFLVAMALSACAAPLKPNYTDVTLSLQADVPVNDGVLLPIDIITINENKAEAVLAISPDLWFGNDMRERLTAEEIQKFAVRDGGSRNITVRVPSETGKIIIYADYENTSEREGQQIIIFSGKDRFRDTYMIRVHNNRLELMP
jgi:hypothetical protein